MSALMEGPQTESLSPLLPEGFQMLTVRVESGTCYLNLPRSDVSLLPEAWSPAAAGPGLVNSLCSANGVDRVQLLLDGQVAASFGRWTSAAPVPGVTAPIPEKSVLPAGGTLFLNDLAYSWSSSSWALARSLRSNSSFSPQLGQRISPLSRVSSSKTISSSHTGQVVSK